MHVAKCGSSPTFRTSDINAFSENFRHYSDITFLTIVKQHVTIYSPVVIFSFREESSGRRTPHPRDVRLINEIGGERADGTE
jgi:hypothetical protein